MAPLATHKLLSAGSLAAEGSNFAAAFPKRKDLSMAAGGKALLFEFMEQHPLLLGRPGMCVRLATFYKKVGLYIQI